MDEFVRIPLNTEISIENIITMHFFDYDTEFVFEGELHDFWELVCVYKGSTKVAAGKEQHTLKEGEIIFHEPNEFHAIHTSNKTSTRLIVITFDANGSGMSFFRNKVASLHERNLDLLDDLIEEGKRFFELSQSASQLTPLRDDLSLSKNGYQTLKNLLELFLLSFLHPEEDGSVEELGSTYSLISSKTLVQQVMNVLKEKKYTSINVTELCNDMHVSKSYMCGLFKKYTGKSIIDYYNSVKIDEAKRMIALDGTNITKISEMLGYSSIHYFSRMFKEYTGMSPTGYAKMIAGDGENISG